jgi:hypothetical protein
MELTVDEVRFLLGVLADHREYGALLRRAGGDTLDADLSNLIMAKKLRSELERLGLPKDPA